MVAREDTIILGDTRFELIKEPEDVSGCYVRISRAGAGPVEVHDFQTRAAARSWVQVNARVWTKPN
jgi:hypothetical protein